MQILTLGVNHQTAPVSIREKIAFQAETLGRALLDFAGRRPVKEAAILSTCNRTELYCNIDEPAQALDWLASYHHLAVNDLKPYLYSLPQDQAVRHAFRVASGLDSMMLGEAQILGQMKQAVRTAEQAGTLGALLHKLFQHTFSVAKEVRTTTDIGSSSVSMAAAAVRLAEQIFATVRGQSVLFIGAGEMIELCAAHFAAHHPKRITVANRTLERANLLAHRFQGVSITLQELPEHLAAHDIIITSTASPLPILGKGMLERAAKARKHRPVFIVDLAVPRDVEAEAGMLDDIFLYTVDDLAGVVQDGVGSRQAAAEEANAIIENNVDHFMHWLEVRSVVPTIRAIRDHADRFRRHELAHAQRRLANGEDPQQVLEKMSRALTNKLLHVPSHALNHVTGDEREALEAWLCRLYQIRRE
ncbi:MAG TPA: glutamyl-tRNA reductase [Betaproteobacteria bacterium]|nr:glutamyl-tRNA reductase [Betaproteobacteria bacterium]